MNSVNGPAGTRGAQKQSPRLAVVVDRLPLVRLGISTALRAAGLDQFLEARYVADGLAEGKRRGASLMVVGDGATDELASAARDVGSAFPVVAMISQATREDLVVLLEAGLAGLLLRSVTPSELKAAASQVLAGERAVGVAFLTVLAGFPAASPGAVNSHGGLTGREREVLVLLAQGASNREIAARLYVAPATVKTHLAHLYAKLGASGRQEALARAVATGLLH